MVLSYRHWKSSSGKRVRVPGRLRSYAIQVVHQAYLYAESDSHATVFADTCSNEPERRHDLPPQRHI